MSPCPQCQEFANTDINSNIGEDDAMEGNVTATGMMMGDTIHTNALGMNSPSNEGEFTTV